MKAARASRRIGLGLGVALLAGCTVGPDYSRPPIPIPTAFPQDAAPAGMGRSQSLGDLAWWSVFRDPALQQLIRRAYAANPDIRLAAARQDLARAQVLSAEADFEPQVRAQANETGQRISPIGLPKNRTSGDPAGSANILGAQATWEIDFWGKYRRANEAGRALLLSSRAAQQAVMSSLGRAVATAYFNLLDLDAQQRDARLALTLREQSLALTQTRLRQGVSSLSDVRAAEIEVQKAHQLIARLQRAGADRESEICELLGETSGPIPRGLSLWQETLPLVQAGLPSALLERRPDIREAEQQLVAATADIGLAESAYFPNIGLTAEGGLESTDLARLFTGDAATWLLQPALNLPVFTGARIRANVLKAKAQRDIAIQQYSATVEGAFKDVAQALAHRDEAERSEMRQAATVEEAASALSLADARLDAGADSLLDALQTRQTSISARMDLADRRYERLAALCQLYSALGGGWRG